MIASLRNGQRLSTRMYLLGLVASVVIPLLLFAAFLLYRFAVVEQRRFESEAAQIARNVGLVIDAELAAIHALLEGLATSSSLSENNFERFHEEARRLVAPKGMVAVLREPGPRQILNTQLPFGAPLPPAPPIGQSELASFEAGRSAIGNVFVSPLSGEPRVPVAIPLRRDGRLAYVFAITVPTTRFRDALLPAVPAGWLIGVGDRPGTIVTRSARHEDMSGKPGLPEYLEKAVGRSGTFESTGFDGTTILAGYYRSDFSGWLYAANVPKAVVAAPLRRSLLALGLLGLAALTLSSLLAYRFSAGLTAATAGLARGARALGEGRRIPEVPTRLAEFALVGEALAAAGAAIEKRSRELETVLGTVPAAVWFTYDPDAKRVVRNRCAAEFMGLPSGESEAFQTTLPPTSRARMLRDGVAVSDQDTPLQRAMRGERLDDEEYTFVFPNGTTRTLLTSGTALRDERGAVHGAVLVGLDITERKQAEDQRRLLLHELNHRVKNTLATVQSIALQTLRGATSLPQARDALTDRLVALAKAHDPLTRESWEGAELHDIVAGATAPHAGTGRFEVEGPPVWLTPALSLSLALALHELATNAAKYGALASSEGRVRISWEVTGPLQAERLRLEWREQGGLPVRPPAHRGFGTRLIERSFSADLDGSATIDFAPDGVRCLIEAPLLEGGSRTPAAVA